jgi:hypothetical protein
MIWWELLVIVVGTAAIVLAVALGFMFYKKR